MTPEQARQAQSRCERRGTCLLYPTSNGKKYGPHKQVYQALVAPLSPGWQVDHTCNQTRCINEHHMIPVSPQQNSYLKNIRNRRQMHSKDLRVAASIHDHVGGIRPDLSKDRAGRGAR